MPTMYNGRTGKAVQVDDFQVKDMEKAGYSAKVRAKPGPKPKPKPLVSSRDTRTS